MVVLPLDHQVQLVTFLENVLAKLGTLEKNAINVKLDTKRTVLEHVSVCIVICVHITLLSIMLYCSM